MSIERIEFLVEEPSMEAALRAMLPSWLGKIEFEVFPFQGKSDLLSELPARLRGYSRYLPENWRVVVLVDRDDQACVALKQQLEAACAKSGVISKSAAKSSRYSVANRIVVEELESWYFGDWTAVCKAFPRIDPTWPNKAGYRDPDAISGGTWEAFERVAQAAGYFRSGLRKVEAATQIGSFLDHTQNTSRSFQMFKNLIDELLEHR